MIRNYKSKNTSNKLNNEVSVNVIIPHETKKKIMRRRPAEERMRERKSTQDIPISNIQQTPANILYGNPNIPPGLSFPPPPPMTFGGASFVFNQQRNGTTTNYPEEMARGLQVQNEEEMVSPTSISLSRVDDEQKKQEEEIKEEGKKALEELGREERRSEERLRERTPSYGSIANIDYMREPSPEPNIEDIYPISEEYNQPMVIYNRPRLIERTPVQNPLLQRGMYQPSMREISQDTTPYPYEDEEPKYVGVKIIGKRGTPIGNFFPKGGKKFNRLLSEGYYYDEIEKVMRMKKKIE